MKPQPVELVAIHGDDITPAEAAWYSTAKEVTEARKKRVPAMLEMLATENHTVPFEHTLVSFRVTSEIASHIHMLKHRIGVSISSQSQRYMELREDLFYVPEDWPWAMREDLKHHVKQSFEMYHDTIKELERLGYDRKRAKESARFYLPYATQIRYRITFNLLSFVHFLRLRNTIDAQDEIHAIAAEMLRLVKESGQFENALKAWGM